MSHPESIHLPEFGKLVEAIGLRPSMYVQPASFDTVSAFIDGYNEALHRAPLLGFHHWLMTSGYEGDNLHWTGVIRRSLPEGISSKDAIQEVCHIILQFLNYRNKNGLEKIFDERVRF
jgi:hypothetical protein